MIRRSYSFIAPNLPLLLAACLFTSCSSDSTTPEMVSPTVVSGPAISNRAPQAQEVSYFPAQGDTVPVNPPGFVWLPEEGAQTYILQCSTTPDFSTVAYEKRGIRLNVHCPASPLKAGNWYWRYGYVDASENQSQWSQARPFAISKDATVFPQPPIEEVISRLSQEHPRLLLRPDTIQTFRNEIGYVSPTLWDELLKEAEEIMTEPVIQDEPAPYPTGKRRSEVKEDIDLWRKNYGSVSKAMERAAHLAFMCRLSGEKKYGERAREWVMAVVSWPADGTTSYKYNDECGMPILYGVARAYSWANDLYSPEDKEKIHQTMRARGQEVYEYLLKARHTVSPFESHRNRAWHFLGEAAVAFIHEIPEAKEWLNYSLDVFFNVYPVWGDSEGGWHEGVKYWNSYMSRIAWWLEILKNNLQIDGYKKPYFQHTGDFPLYVMPPGNRRSGFGDTSDTGNANIHSLLMRTFARHVQNPYWWWYSEQAPTVEIEHLTYKDAVLARQPSIQPKAPNDIPASKIFHGVGIASLHTSLSEPQKDVHFLFKSSPFGSQSHGNNAQNAFELSAFTYPLLISSGHRDWHGSPHHKGWMWQTHSNNSITVNGQGQKPHSADAKGKIVHEFLGERIDYVAGDASAAYEGRLQKFIRHVFFLKSGVVLLVDEVEAPEPALFQSYLHSYNEFNLRKESQYEIYTDNEDATVRIALISPAGLNVTQTSGFEPPLNGYELNQWHLKAETAEPQKRVFFVTLLRPYQTGTHTNVMVDYNKKEDSELFGILVDVQSIGLVLNPTAQRKTFATVETDSPLMLIVQNIQTTEESFIFAVDAGYIKVGDKTLVQSDSRSVHYSPYEEFKEVQEAHSEKIKNASETE